MKYLKKQKIVRQMDFRREFLALMIGRGNRRTVLSLDVNDCIYLPIDCNCVLCGPIVVHAIIIIMYNFSVQYISDKEPNES